MEVIHVGLYGGKGIFSGKEAPLEASVVSCDQYMSCSYYQNNQCLKVRSIGGMNCKFGEVSTMRGYTSRSQKYREFKSKWKNHEKYNKLNHPSNKLGLIKDYVIFPYPFIHIEVQAKGDIQFNNPLLGVNITAFIPSDKFTVDFIHRLCSFKPQALMGGEIRDYREKVVPMFISHLKEVMPEKYQELIKKYDGYKKMIDYVGRTVLLRTINPCLVHYKSSRYSSLDEEWYWDGEYLIYKGGHLHKFNITNDYSVEEIKIKPSNKATIKISSNDQVSSQTVFID
ncbi:hypothetical protein ACFVS2_25115 [Brevibacillus sp. NPDC058079]|uniref:hypothetical protein n=1 Tax=Brevibacillus sp. NPDC058079 TaxID=3346330 RepID=UPI0036EDBFFC